MASPWILFVILLVPNILISAQEQVPCLFFFGDSQFDNGNNNNLNTQAKVDYAPYGIDYINGVPTGRFSNGENMADYLAQFLGFNVSIPPYATAGSNVLKGVNYASGGAGILDESGRQLGERISLNRQLINHLITIARLPLLLRSLRVCEYLNKCMYVVNMGSNDYINNYLLPQSYPLSAQLTPDQFAARLVRQYCQQLTTLYNTGARKIAVYGIGLLGCIPQQFPAFPRNGSSPCNDLINSYVALFNNQLIPLLNNLNANLPGAQFTYINVTSMSSGDPSAIGIVVANAPCCQVSSVGQCVPNSVPCTSRNQYVYWDNFHLNEFLNLVTASRSYNASLPSDASPVDIRRLALQ